MPKKEYMLIDWDYVYNLARGVSQKIRDSGFMPDIVVAIARGGWCPARILCDFLLQKNLYSINIEHWGITASITGEAKITNPLHIDLSGKRVLIVDDIADTGESVKIALGHIKTLGAKEVKTATLQYITTSSFVPDYYEETLEQWKWVVFPWNFHEDVSNITGKVLAEKGKMRQEEIKKALEKDLGISITSKRLREVIDNMEFHRKIKREGKFLVPV
jgi:hypothetical protein